MYGRNTKRSGNRWEISESQIREFEDQISRHGGIDYAALCLDCLPAAERDRYLSKLKSNGQTTRQISKRWREANWKKAK